MVASYMGGVYADRVELFDPGTCSLLNTLLLLTSGTTVTWAHHALLENDRQGLKFGLVLTILLGMCFTLVQAIEYSHAGFAYSGNIYGAAFFMATGFHGFHVIVGTIFLIVCLIRAQMGQFTPTKHLGFEFAAWYWHSSSTWFGCSSSPRSMSGARGGRRSAGLRSRRRQRLRRDAAWRVCGLCRALCFSNASRDEA